MKRLLLAGAAAVCFCGPARAQWMVVDPALVAGQIRELANDASSLANQAAQIRHAVQTVEAVAHGNLFAVANLVPELSDLGLINPIDEDTVSIREGLAGVSELAGAAGGLVRETRRLTQVYEPVGNDYTAVGINVRATSAATQLAYAERALDTARRRLGVMPALRRSIDGTADVKDATDAAARMGAETATQLAQTNQLLALSVAANAQRDVREAQREQAFRASATQMVADAEAAMAKARAGQVAFVTGTGVSPAVMRTAPGSAGGTGGVSVGSAGSGVVSSSYGAGSTSALDAMTRNLGDGAVQAAIAQGVDPNAASAVCMAESGCRNLGAHSTDPKMTASGPFGYTNPTFNATAAASGIDVSAGKNDGAVQTALASYDLKQTARTLQGAGIDSPTALDAYGAHMFGRGNAVNLATAPDNAQLSSVLRGTSATTLAANKLTGVTVGQWRQNVSGRMGGAANVPVLI